MIILTKWESVTLADILTNFAEIPTGPLALFTLSDLINFLIMLLALPYDRSNLLRKHKFWIFWMAEWLPYMQISLAIISSWDASEEFRSDKGFWTEDVSTTSK